MPVKIFLQKKMVTKIILVTIFFQLLSSVFATEPRYGMAVAVQNRTTAMVFRCLE
jgi:hypothetical protein